MERRTAIPVYDVGCYAEEAELALVRPTNMPPSFIANSVAMDGIPMATVAEDGVRVPMLTFLQALLLLYVDGVSSFAEIMERSGLSEPEVREGFDELLQAGVVTLASVGERAVPTRSSVVPRPSSPPFSEEMWSFVIARD